MIKLNISLLIFTTKTCVERFLYFQHCIEHGIIDLGQCRFSLHSRKNKKVSSVK